MEETCTTPQADQKSSMANHLQSAWHGEADLPVMAVGPWHRGEFCIVREEIDPQTRWPTFGTLEQAITAIEQQAVVPELLLLAQPRPGIYRQVLLAQLQTLAPLMRVVVVAGSWCEGELRTGQPLHGTLRLYWHEMAAWWKYAMATWAAGECPLWSLPLEEELWRPIQPATIAGNTTCSGTRLGLIEIDSPQQETFSALAAALAPHGWSAVWQPRGRPRAAVAGAKAGIWDGGQFDPPEQSQLAEFCQTAREPNARVIVLLDFPRAEHIHMAAEAGASAVLAKPYMIDDLLIKLAG